MPARDEATTLPRLLASLSVGDVVVVDDGSRDATAAVARSGGARVVTATPPPPGWTGKAWACHLGARATTGEVLVFLDADVELAPRALGALLALHEQHGGLLSVQPHHRAVRVHEQLSAYANAVSVLASGAFTRGRAGRPMAFGPCLVTSRADYERAGGHGAVRGEVLDDVRLAAAYADAGLPVRCVLGGEQVRMRSYPDGLAQLASGWTKNVASGASASAPLPLLGTAVWVCAHHGVAVGTVRAAVSVVAARGAWPASGVLVLWAAGWLALAAQLRGVLDRLGSFRWWTWAVFPVPLVAFDGLFVASAAATVVRRRVRWRGRPVVVGRASRDPR